MAPVSSNIAFVQVLEHEKMIEKGPRMCIMVGDRVVIGVNYVVLATSILHEPVIQLYFFLSVCAANGQSPVSPQKKN